MESPSRRLLWFFFHFPPCGRRRGGPGRGGGGRLQRPATAFLPHGSSRRPPRTGLQVEVRGFRKEPVATWEPKSAPGAESGKRRLQMPPRTVTPATSLPKFGSFLPSPPPFMGGCRP